MRDSPSPILHLVHPREASWHTLIAPLAHALRLASAPSVEQFRSELERRMVAVIALLRMLEIVSPSAPSSIQRADPPPPASLPPSCQQSEYTMGADWRSYESYRTIMARRLAEECP